MVVMCKKLFFFDFLDLVKKFLRCVRLGGVLDLGGRDWRSSERYLKSGAVSRGGVCLVVESGGRLCSEHRGSFSTVDFPPDSHDDETP